MDWEDFGEILRDASVDKRPETLVEWLEARDIINRYLYDDAFDKALTFPAGVDRDEIISLRMRVRVVDQDANILEYQGNQE